MLATTSSLCWFGQSHFLDAEICWLDGMHASEKPQRLDDDRSGIGRDRETRRGARLHAFD